MNSNRRKFVRMFLSLGAGLGLLPWRKASAQDKGEKVKMLTPDGKLVEVDKSVLQKAVSARASNEEVQAWMKTGERIAKK